MLLSMLALAAALLAASSPHNVVLVTWDGVRWQDAFNRGPEAALQRFWSRHADRATVFGDPDSQVRFEVANDSLVSLPSYQELMVGGPTPCITNACGPVQRETLVDVLVRRGTRTRVVGSWESIADAASQHELKCVDAGRHEGDPGAPWTGARLDRATWARAMAALEQRPRFLWISLNDADEWGHRGRREAYVLTLRRYDIWLDELIEKLRTMEGYGENTTIIVTTDHGRGDGDSWAHHGWAQPESRRTFAFAIGPGTGARLAGAQTFTLRSMRPTIEALLGLEPGARALPGVLPQESAAALGP